jgi:hypothetical protein
MTGGLLCRPVTRTPTASVPVRTGTTVPPVVLLGVVAVLLGVFLAVRLAVQGATGFVLAGADFVSPQAGLPVTPGGGYDGQFVYRLALDPLTTVPADGGIAFDAPGYRQQRIATAALAWLVALLPGVSTAVALITVNAAAVLAAAWFGMRLAVGCGRHPAWGLAVGLPAFLPISVGRDLTEPLEWAAVLAGLYFWRTRRLAPAAAALTLAVLARETALLVVAGLALAALWQAVRPSGPGAVRPGAVAPGPAVSGDRVGSLVPRPSAPPRAAAAGPLVPRPRSGTGPGPGARLRAVVPVLAWLAVPVVLALAWQGWLWSVWGSPAFGRGPGNNLAGFPVIGVLDTVLTGVPPTQVGLSTSTAARLAWGVERVGLLLLILYAGWAVLRRRTSVPAGEQVAWGFAVLLAVALRGWTYDVQFLRAAAEAIGLSLLVALGVPGRSGRVVLAGSAVATLLIAAQYALVP